MEQIHNSKAKNNIDQSTGVKHVIIIQHEAYAAIASTSFNKHVNFFYH